MLKASWGGGGRGMRIVEDDRELIETVAAARREAKAAFGKDEVYLEKLIRRARHVEVQILGDSHGNLVHLYERDCTVQRRNQKVVERAPAAFLSDAQRSDLCEAALKIGRAVGYRAAGTVEFLQDADTGKFYFIEVNPRIQVEHTVTECVTGIDLVKAQIRIAAGARIGTPESGVPRQEDIRVNAHALQCRVTTEDPENNFVPDYGTRHGLPQPGRIRHPSRCRNRLCGRHHHALLRFPAGQGDGLVADPRRDHRAHAPRAVGISNSRRGDEFALPRSADHASAIRVGRLHHQVHRSRPRNCSAARASAIGPRGCLSFIGDVIVNGNPEVKGRARPKQPVFPRLPRVVLTAAAGRHQAKTRRAGAGEVCRSGCWQKPASC